MWDAGLLRGPRQPLKPGIIKTSTNKKVRCRLTAESEREDERNREGRGWTSERDGVCEYGRVSVDLISKLLTMTDFL